MWCILVVVVHDITRFQLSTPTSNQCEELKGKKEIKISLITKTAPTWAENSMKDLSAHSKKLIEKIRFQVHLRS